MDADPLLSLIRSNASPWWHAEIPADEWGYVRSLIPDRARFLAVRVTDGRGCAAFIVLLCDTRPGRVSMSQVSAEETLRLARLWLKYREPEAIEVGMGAMPSTSGASPGRPRRVGQQCRA
jgi:hypothetical protein